MRTGVCRFCKCSHFKPCPAGCGWADRALTVCTECLAMFTIWKRLPASDEQFAHAFFRGFAAGNDDERATETTNPYAAAPTNRSGSKTLNNPRRRYWELGFRKGQAWKEKHAA